jgi:class 3 adenylate cyclase
VDIERFEFARSRGVVWVCDLVNSSKFLNDDETVDDLEAFLPRLHWTASMIVDAAGGRLIKWTGDGFLAWFETPLHRTLGERAAAVFDAAWHLTVLVNVTQLGLNPRRKFQARHGVTYEQDALLVKIAHPGSYESLDIIGRAVVLAFRLSGAAAPFPGIVTQKELVDASAGHRTAARDFHKWHISSDDKLRYFKGERWSTTTLYKSSSKKSKTISPSSASKSVRRAIAKAEQADSSNDASVEFAETFLTRMQSGPDWCRQVIDEYVSFLRDDLLGTLKLALPLLESQPEKLPNRSDDSD